jgi:hypothetical protein
MREATFRTLKAPPIEKHCQPIDCGFESCFPTQSIPHFEFSLQFWLTAESYLLAEIGLHRREAALFGIAHGR